MVLGVMTMAAPKVVFSSYEDIREALSHPHISRRFDTRSYAEGNTGDGTVSTAHGDIQRARRRVENTQFRTEHLREYERVLFPALLSEMLDEHAAGDHVDLASIAPLITAVLAAKRAGFDVDHRDLPRLRQVIAIVDIISNGLGPGLLEMKDPEGARQQVRAALEEFERDFVRPAWTRRSAAIETHRQAGTLESIAHQDVLTALLVYRDDPALDLEDDGRIVREVATYLQGGTHTSSQTLLNTLDFLMPRMETNPAERRRVADDRLYVARCIHESLRLRPVTPQMKRRAEADVEIAGVAIPADTMVVLDVEAANRSEELYGPDAAEFNPDRQLRDGVPRWGLSFGFGPHLCPGRSSAVGLPVPSDFQPREDHLYGQVPLMVQETARRGVRRDPERTPTLDDRSERRTFTSFPVLFDARSASA
jgi:cytochrome P450